MRKKLWVALAYLSAAALFFGIPVAALVINPRYESPRDVELRELRERADSLAGELAAAHAEADSLRAVVTETADTVLVYVDTYRERAGRLQARLDSILAEPATPTSPAVVSVDEAADVLREADRMADACTRLVGDCEAALGAQDAALALADSALDAERERAAALERYQLDLAARLRSAERSRWYYAIGGAALSLSVCRASR